MVRRETWTTRKPVSKGNQRGEGRGTRGREKKGKRMGAWRKGKGIEGGGN